MRIMVSSVRYRLLLSHLVVIILAMGLSGTLLLSFLENYFLQATEESLLAQARITAQGLIPGAMLSVPGIESQSPFSNAVQQQAVSNLTLQTENANLPNIDFSSGENELTDLEAASIRLGALIETRIRILDGDGVVFFDTWLKDVGMDLRTEPLINEAFAGQYSSDSVRSSDEAVMYLALPVESDGGGMVVVYLSQPLRDIILVLQDVRNRLFTSTAIALVFSALVGLFLSGAITRPIEQLTRAVGTIAEGKFDQEVEVKSRDEIGRLGTAFNDMSTRLYAARQMQIDFVANVSHELRTPLTSVKGMIETLRAGAVDDLEVRDQFLKTIEDETNRLTRMVSDLLVLSQADSEALNLSCKKIYVNDIIQTILNRFELEIETKRITLELDIGSDLPPVWADVDRVEQILINLLDNAINYSHVGGCVTVKIRIGSKDSLIVQVRDEGVGIPPEALSRIGERFYRTDEARSRSSGGSGLGLAIARTLTEAQGGKLWLESEVGVGTTVSFSLPIA